MYPLLSESCKQLSNQWLSKKLLPFYTDTRQQLERSSTAAQCLSLINRNAQQKNNFIYHATVFAEAEHKVFLHTLKSCQNCLKSLTVKFRKQRTLKEVVHNSKRLPQRQSHTCMGKICTLRELFFWFKLKENPSLSFGRTPAELGANCTMSKLPEILQQLFKPPNICYSIKILKSEYFSSLFYSSRLQ